MVGAKMAHNKIPGRIFHAVEPRAHGEGEETDGPGPMGVEPALPGMGEGAFGAKDHERAVDREADIHHRSTDRSLDEDEAQPAHAGNRRRADIEAPEPPVETGSRAAYRADQLHRAQEQQASAGAEMEAEPDDRLRRGRSNEDLALRVAPGGQPPTKEAAGV